MEWLTAASTVLDNYWSRSQVFRLMQFSSALASGLVKGHPPLAEKLLGVSAAISNMRVMLRLLDDLPILAHVLKNWTQSQDAAVLERLSELVSSFCTQLYYPVEHVAWAADQQLLALDSTPVWTIAILLWTLPLLITLTHTIKKLTILRAQLHHYKISPSLHTEDIRKLLSQQFSLSLTCVQTLCDLGLAVFWLPTGVLWAGKLQPFWWGLLGTVSSLIALYKTIQSQ